MTHKQTKKQPRPRGACTGAPLFLSGDLESRLSGVVCFVAGGWDESESAGIGAQFRWRGRAAGWFVASFVVAADGRGRVGFAKRELRAEGGDGAGEHACGGARRVGRAVGWKR